MKIYSIAEMIQNWADVMRSVCNDKEHVLMSRHGKIVAVMIPIEEAKKVLYAHKKKPSASSRTGKSNRSSDQFV